MKGVLGLAPANSTTTYSIMTALIDAGALDEPIVAFKFEYSSTGTTSVNFGATDSSDYTDAIV